MEPLTVEPYEPPRVRRQSIKAMNTYSGEIWTKEICPEMEGFDASELLARFGSPLFVFSESLLRKQFRAFQRAFTAHYPDTIIAYSYKTNYLPGICAIFHSEGAWAEVVSGFEYRIAEDLGVPGERIVFNGPYKKISDLERAASRGSIINVDSFDEIADLTYVAAALKKTVAVGLRVNMQLNHPPWNKFGFNLETEEAMEACRLIVAAENLRLEGFHIHAGTFMLDTTIYERAVQSLLGLAVRAEEELGITVRFLDLGGGYASRNTLRGHFLQGEATSPTPEQYAETICASLQKGLRRLKGTPMLILEPGRALVDEAAILVTRVVSTKRLSNGIKALVIDAGSTCSPPRTGTSTRSSAPGPRAARWRR